MAIIVGKTADISDWLDKSDKIFVSPLNKFKFLFASLFALAKYQKIPP